jgi:hypothetical protein
VIIRNHNDLVNYFVNNQIGYAKLVRQITGQEPIGYPDTEVRVPGQKTGRIDAVAATKDHKIAFELYYVLPGISEVIQKIQQRRERATNVAIWVAVIPQSHAREYGVRLSSQEIHVAWWCETDSQVQFEVAARYQVHDP